MKEYTLSSVFTMGKDIEREFNDAFGRYSDELFRHASLRLADRERALELTQEAFLRSFEYATKGQEVRDWRPFLYRTLRNLIIDEYRKHKTTSLDAMLTDEDGGTIEALLPQDDSNTLQSAMERFDGKRALSHLEHLPDSYREVLICRYVDGLSPKEIAKLLSESENVISVRIHRGLKKLRALMEPQQ